MVKGAYIKDLSAKVKSAKRIQMKRGENIVAKAIYGYYKSDAGKWEPEEPAAGVVREIFAMALRGIPPTLIKNELFKLGYPTPQEHQDMKWGKDVVPTCLWETRRVKEILENEQYIGSYVAGKWENKSVSGPQKLADKNNWIVIPDKHTPIISKEDFAKVQELFSTKLKSVATIKPIDYSIHDEQNHSRRLRMLNGERTTGAVIYGYKRVGSKEIGIDEPAAKVIREIFQLALQGLSVNEIRSKLTEEQYPVPLEYIALNKGRDIIPTCKWTAKCVRNILKNEQYKGSFVAGTLLKDLTTGKQYHTNRKEWIVIPDSHIAIIDKEDFDKVQTLFTDRRHDYKKRDATEFLLKGKVRCGICDKALYYDNIRNPVFRCYNTHADPNAECRHMKVTVSELDEAVLSIILKHAEVLIGTSDISKLRKIGSDEKKFSDCENNIRCNMEERQNLYERYVRSEIDRDTYTKQKKILATQAEKLNRQLELMKKAVQDKDELKKSAEIAKKVLNNAATPREIVDILIKTVYVFPNNRIDIKWKIADFMEAGNGQK